MSFCLDLELFAKIKKTWILHTPHSFFTFLLITQDLNKILKNPANPFVDIIKVENVYKILAENIRLYSSWSSSKFSIFQKNNLVS